MTIPYRFVAHVNVDRFNEQTIGMTIARTPWWAWTWPVLAWVILSVTPFASPAGFIAAAAGGALILAVFAAVHHAEVVAHRTGEPFGTLVLAVAVTIIEVALIGRASCRERV